MKLIETYVLADRGRTSKQEGWISAYRAIASAITRMTWPPDGSKFRIPRRIKKPDLRNGVVPIKKLFRELMSRGAWTVEAPLKLDDYFSTLRKSGLRDQLFRYPSLQPVTDALHEGLGNFDFWFRSTDGFRTAVEWETGNISSSHRSLNKMSMALNGGLLDAAVLVVPSNAMYPHLTDRIGNIRELQPYFYGWSMSCSNLERGLMAIMVVEQDELFDSTDPLDFIPRARTGRSKKRRKRSR